MRFYIKMLHWMNEWIRTSKVQSSIIYTSAHLVKIILIALRRSRKLCFKIIPSIWPPHGAFHFFLFFIRRETWCFILPKFFHLIRVLCVNIAELSRAWWFVTLWAVESFGLSTAHAALEACDWKISHTEKNLRDVFHANSKIRNRANAVDARPRFGSRAPHNCEVYHRISVIHQ